VLLSANEIIKILETVAEVLPVKKQIMNHEAFCVAFTRYCVCLQLSSRE
jgi:hypothetical protein